MTTSRPDETSGALVSEVFEGSPADKAGIKTGDVVTAVNGKQVRTGGELRNMWGPTPQEGLWFTAGSLAQCRIYSRYLALQIKAREDGLIG